MKTTNNILEEITLQELLHAINILGSDQDIYVDGYDPIAVCPPVKLTPEAKESFRDTLNTRVLVSYKDNTHDLTYVCGVNVLHDADAYLFLTFLSGNCTTENYDKWFNGPNAKLL